MSFPLKLGRSTPPGAGRRVRTPTVFQMEAVECGAAALSMILAHFGRIVPLEELRIACGISRDGSRANNLVKAARRYGLKAEGYRMEPADLKQQAMPVIVYWNFNHFLVLEGFGRDRVYLNDPAAGARSVPEAEFDQSFTGVVLVCEPGPGFRKGGAASSVWNALRTRLRGSLGGLLYVVLTSIALVSLGLVTPAFTRVFIDTYLVSGLRDWLLPIMAGMAMSALLLMALTALRQHGLLRLETKLALSMSSRYFWHVLRLPVEFFAQRYAGDIASRVAINDSVAQLLSGVLAANVLNVALVVLFLVLMVQIDAGLTVLGAGIALLNVAALRVAAGVRADGNRRLLLERSKLTGASYDGLQSIESLKAGGSESDFFARWSGHQAKVVNAEQELARTTTILAAVPPLLSALNASAILTIGGLRIMNGEMSIGTLVAFQALMFGFIHPVNQLVGLGGVLQETQGDLNRLDDVLHYPLAAGSRTAAVSGDRAPSEAGKLAGAVELRDVSFGYSRLEAPLIESFKLTLKPGMRVALVGGSGSGKSTVARLLGGLYEPWCGEILFDGQPRSAIAHERLNSSLALVDQDIFLFEGSVRQNLSLWDHTVPDSVLIQAARDALIHDDVVRRPGGYEFALEEGGRNFSGGQRQRLEIARALAGNPTILVLDEATSALDPLTEQQIDENLRRRGCTCLIVAHRLSTIRDCDEILVMERGRVVERGTHEQLLQLRGAYASLMRVESPSRSVLDLLDE